MNADDFRVGVLHRDKDIGAAFRDGDGLGHVSPPHLVDLVGDDGSVMYFLVPTFGAMGREQSVFAHHPPDASRAGANSIVTQARPNLAVALAMKAGCSDLLADMIGEFCVQARADRSRTMPDRRRRRFEKTVHAGARNAPDAGNPGQAIAARSGGR